MASTFFGLNIAYTGVMAANAKVTTTANNIANVETKGYSRQETNQVASEALKISQSYGMAGSGVDTKSIVQIRNQFYDVKYWQSQTNLGQYEIKEHYMYQIEDYFTDKDTVEGFEPIYEAMFNDLETVYNNAGDDPKKTQFLGQAGNLTRYFNNQAVNLSKLQLDINEEIKDRADHINAIAEQIATLNKQINTIEITKTNANELRDRRALLLDELSKIVNISVNERPVYMSGSSDIKSGANIFEVSIGGQLLVSGNDFNTLSCTARKNKVNQSDAEGLYDIEWSNGLEFNLYGANLGGELKGLIELRDGNNEEFFHGSVSNISAGANAGEYKVTVKLPTPAPDYMTDLNKLTLAAEGQINVANNIFNYSSWTYDKEAGTYTFTFKPEEGQVVPDISKIEGREVSIGRAVNFQGIPYYQEQLNEWTRIFARAMNEIEKTAVDAYGNQAEVMFTAKNDIIKENLYDFSDYNATRTVFSSDEDDYYQLTAANFQVNHNMEKDINKFGTTADIHKGSDAQDVTELLLTVKSDKSKAQFRGCTSQEFLQCITADIALSANNAKTFTDNYENINKSISNQRMSISGVDNDEEALNLVKFQEAYNLSAKVMQIMTEIYDRLILETGV